MFSDEDIFESYFEEIAENQNMINDRLKREGLSNYDYSTDDLDDYEYQQDQY